MFHFSANIGPLCCPKVFTSLPVEGKDQKIELHHKGMVGTHVFCVDYIHTFFIYMYILNKEKVPGNFFKLSKNFKKLKHFGLIKLKNKETKETFLKSKEEST